VYARQWPTAADVYFCKFVTDHIFLQNREKNKYKKILDSIVSVLSALAGD
jgi:hypothetical protein